MQPVITRVSAIYPTEQAARTSIDSLQQEGFSAKQIYLVGPAPTPQGGMPATAAPDVLDIEEMLERLITSDVILAGGSAGAGVADTRTVRSRMISLFLATPVFRSLAAKSKDNLLKYTDHTGESLKVSEEDFATIARQAVEAGHWILLVDNKDEHEAEQGRRIVERTYD
ncbi:MAG: hypothetical protein WAN46_17720 [Gammaproteobacteria bacterium]|jgi:hypothetical protein